VILAIRIVATCGIWKVVPCYSVGEFERLQGLPPGAKPLIPGHGQFWLPIVERLDGGGHLGDRLVTPERRIVEQVDKTAII
jgi:hypothetical protein